MARDKRVNRHLRRAQEIASLTKDNTSSKKFPITCRPPLNGSRLVVTYRASRRPPDNNSTIGKLSNYHLARTACRRQEGAPVFEAAQVYDRLRTQ
jgi:hypothetical protein